MGVVRADPNEYVAKFGETLRTCAELPDFVKNIRHPDNIPLACDQPPPVCRLEGDLDALSLIDLDREGLSEFKAYLQPKLQTSTLHSTMTYTEPMTRLVQSSSSMENVLSQIMQVVEMQNRNKLSESEAKVILALLNEKLGRKYSEQQAERFLDSINPHRLEWIDLNSFKNAVLASKF